MGYYDSIKDSVRENNKDEDEDENEMNSNSSSGSGNFDTLKQNAEETAEEENKGDDTPIEVVDEDGIKPEMSSDNSNTSGNNTSPKNDGNPLTSNNSGSNGSADMSGVEDKLDKIIDQNQKMIEILESFGQ